MLGTFHETHIKSVQLELNFSMCESDFIALENFINTLFGRNVSAKQYCPSFEALYLQLALGFLLSL